MAKGRGYSSGVEGASWTRDVANLSTGAGRQPPGRSDLTLFPRRTRMVEGSPQPSSKTHGGDRRGFSGKASDGPALPDAPQHKHTNEAGLVRGAGGSGDEAPEGFMSDALCSP